jgi:hypothetical protein
MPPPLRLLLAAATLAVATGADAGDRTAESLRAVLPKFDPAKSAAAKTGAGKVERPVAQEGVTVLPDFKVTEKKVAQPTPDQWLTGAEVTRREVRRAEAAMNPLELALNRWHIPLLMPSFKDRVRAAYEEKQRAEETERLESLQRLPGN